MDRTPATAETDSPREACGVFGIYGRDLDVAKLTYFGLHALQHRGQESAGIASADGRQMQVYRRMGLVSHVFSEEILEDLQGILAVGHTRYSTKGSSSEDNSQPIFVEGPLGPLALAHNGNLVNAERLLNDLEDLGVRPKSSTDSEIAAWLIALAPGGTWTEKLQHTLPRLVGSYSFVMATTDHLLAARDPLGNRPLCLGTMDGSWVVASESCALNTVGAEFARELEPGELVSVGEEGMRSYRIQPVEKRAVCMFEFMYLARPDSYIEDRLLYHARREMGRQLARERPAPNADLVMGVPECAIAAAQGYAEESGLPLRDGLVRNRYIHRTFIQPTDQLRRQGAQMKYNPMPEVLEGQRVVVVDDSIVRGTNTLPIVKMLRQAGVAEVHVRIAAPPIRHPCFLGVDMPTRGEIIASAFQSREEAEAAVGAAIQADSLGYLSIEGIVKAVDLPYQRFCLACFNGDYPVPVQMEFDKLSLEQLRAPVS